MLLFIDKLMAERVGFEPTEPRGVHLISSQARSATPAPLRFNDNAGVRHRFCPANELAILQHIQRHN